MHATLTESIRPHPTVPPMPGRPLAVLFFTIFLDLVGFGIVIPILPLYAERFGAGPIAIGALLAIYSLMQFFFAPWWGRLSDRIGRRPVLLFSLLGAASAYLLYGFAESLLVLFAARAVNGMTAANIGVAQAYIADVTPPERRARGMGMIGAAFGLGFIFGPVIGGLLAKHGAAAPFLGAAALTFTNLVLAFFFLREPVRRREAAPALARLAWYERLRVLTRLRARTRVETLYTVSFLITLAIACIEATFALWGSRRWGLDATGVAFLFVYLGSVAVLAQGLVVGRLVRWGGERRTVVIGAAALVLGLSAIPFAPTWTTLAIALAAMAFGQGITNPTVAALLSRSVAAHEQGQTLNTSQSLSALGRVIGSVAGGVAFGAVSIAAPYFAGAAIVVVALWVLRTHLPGAEVAA
jgi:MFS transporter, DHA1 family, tetracycline resistance protein